MEMDFHVYGKTKLIIITFLTISVIGISSALPKTPRNSSSSNSTTQINSKSVLVALLDSHYTELAELVEKALLQGRL
ncbi:hypothetical protein ACHQM5_005365 [Ranunculus cassubicifolius]